MVKGKLTSYQILGLAAGMVLAGAAMGEHLFRRVVERRYRAAVASREALERQYAEALATHDQVKQELAEAREQSHELAQALAAKHTELEEAVGRLTEEAQTIRELQMRLAAMQSQMDQLQGELALAIQRGSGEAVAQDAGAVQLERIIVGDAKVAGQQGRVVSVHSQWSFVIIDLGWNAVRIGDTLSIFRDDQLIAKARVERVQEGVSAATLLPEWGQTAIQVNDVARVL